MPYGLPMAKTHCPTFSLPAEPWLTGAAAAVSTWSTAMSRCAATAIIVGRAVRPSAKRMISCLPGPDDMLVGHDMAGAVPEEAGADHPVAVRRRFDRHDRGRHGFEQGCRVGILARQGAERRPRQDRSNQGRLRRPLQ